MLRWRLLFAAIFIAPLLLLLAIDFQYSGVAPGVWLFPLGLGVASLASYEMIELLDQDRRLVRGAIMTGVVGIYGAACIPVVWGFSGEPYPADCPLGRLGWPLTATVIGVVALFLVEMARYREPGEHVVHIALGTFILVYIGLFLSYLPLLRSFSSNQVGMVALLSVLLIVKMSDTGAYTVGKLMGRRALAPLLSPKKTVEGVVGGLLTAAAVSLGYFTWIAPWIVGEPMNHGPLQSVVYGIVLAVAGMIGDLCESLLKRDRQQKDSSGWLPGLGGVLDIVDSILVTTPLAYLCWTMGLVG